MIQKKLTGISTLFRCWSRKKFAVFNSLNKILKICTLCVSYSFIALPGELQAQSIFTELQTKDHQLSEVLVIAERTPIEALKASRIVTIISKSEIERSPVRNLNDLLRNVAGIDIRQRGPLGAQADISIRGGTFDQTLILLNGVNITDPQTGHHNLNLPIDFESIERIEIIHGPAAKSFGPNAFNGAVNIITGNNKPNHLRTSLTLGQYGLYNLAGNISNTIGKLKHFISLNHVSSDGYINNSDFSGASFFYQAGYESKRGTFDFQSGFNKRDFGANRFYSLKYPDQFESTKSEFASLKYQSNSQVKLASTFYWRRHHDRFELKRNNDSIPFNHHLTNTAGLNLNTWTMHRFGKTSFGIDFRNEDIVSNVLGHNLNVPREVQGFDGSFYTKHYNRMNTSFYAEHSFSMVKLTVNTGAMVHHNTNLTKFSIYPGIDVSYLLNRQFRLYSSANKTLRMPTFTDMFYKSPTQQGNSRLKPEEAFTLEGGIKFNSSLVKANASIFRRWGHNMIDWVKAPSADSIIWRSMNNTQINFAGLESSLTFIPSKESRFHRITAIRLNYSFLQADTNSNNMLSKYALDYLRHKFSSGIDAAVAGKLNISARISYSARNGLYQNVTGQIVPYKSFWLSDVKLFWKEEKYILYTEISNIFNTSYNDFGGIIQPGIWIRGGLEVNFNYRDRLIQRSD